MSVCYIPKISNKSHTMTYREPVPVVCNKLNTFNVYQPWIIYYIFHWQKRKKIHVIIHLKIPKTGIFLVFSV